jgi:hypothetical protein
MFRHLSLYKSLDLLDGVLPDCELRKAFNIDS